MHDLEFQFRRLSKRLANASAILLALFVFGVGYVRGQVVYQNGQPDNRNGSEMTRWIEADDFFLNQSTRLERVRFWDFEIDGYFSGTVTWQIYADNGSGKPAQVLFSGTSVNLSRVATGFSIFGAFKEYVTTFDILPVSLPRGTYWLALHNGQLSNTSTENFYWEATPNTSGSASHAKIAPFTGFWNSNAFPTLPSDFAFEIHGALFPTVTAFALNDNARTVSFTTMAGRSYRVDYKSSLTDPSWTPLGGAEAIAGTGDVVQVVDSSVRGGAQATRFYRIGFSYSGAGAPAISSFAVAAGGPQISFNAAPGYYYRVEYKNDLRDSSWNAVSGGEMIVGEGEVVHITDSDPNLSAQSHRLYRVVLF